MLSDADIHAIYQNIRQYNHISSEPYQQYLISLQKQDTIDLYNVRQKMASIPTTQLSDIHAILQLCHPDTPYYIQYGIYLSEKIPGISIYSYHHAPNILTTDIPPTHLHNAYMLQPIPACCVTVSPNEPLMDTMTRIRQQTEQAFAFVHQYPHIDMKPCGLNSVQQIPHINHTKIRITARRVHPSNIGIDFELSNEYGWTCLQDFVIPTQDLPALTDRYTAHMHHIAPALIQDIQENFACSQHAKMNIIRQCVPYFIAPDNNVFACIQDCAHILINHYARTPPISPP